VPISVLVVIVGVMLIAAIVWNSRNRRGTAANSDGSSWTWSGDGGSNSADGNCDSGSDGGGGCDGGGGDGGGGGD